MCLSNKFFLYTVYILAVTAERAFFNILLPWIFSYFGVASFSKSVSASVGSSEDDSKSDVESLEPHPPKKHCSAKSKEIPTQRKYNKKWEKVSCG